MIDIGVAKPSAQGQAMINTATALSKRVSHRRLRPEQRPDNKSDNSDQHHRGNEIAGDDVGELLDRRAAALRFGDHAHDLRQKRVAADALGAHHKTSRAVDRPAGYPAAFSFFYRDRLAGDHRFIDRGRAFEHDAVDRNFFAGANAQTVADLHALERHIHFACRRRAAVARSWAPALATL